MRILYGVVGEGMGHAMRSRVILEHLTSQKEHDVTIMASGRAVDYLQKRFAETASAVNRIHGLHIIYEENRVRRSKTLSSNIVASATGVPKNIAAYFDLVSELKPEVVISDFESWTYLYAKSHRLPILSIDNMQVINRCLHDDEILEGEKASFELTRAFVKSKLPFCDEYFITTFFRPPLRKPKTRLFPPILRPEILEAKRRKGEHLLVYQTAEGNTALVEALQKTGLECRLYGMRREIEEEQVEGNLRYRPFSETVFIDDLASARAVIAGGGFTLMGEAVYLHKPMLAVPVGGQFEQVLNARYLEREGFGAYAKTLSDAGVIEKFVASIPACEDKLATYTQSGNDLIFSAVDETLDRFAAGVS